MFEDFRDCLEYEMDDWIVDDDNFTNIELLSLYPDFWSEIW